MPLFHNTKPSTLRVFINLVKTVSLTVWVSLLNTTLIVSGEESSNDVAKSIFFLPLFFNLMLNSSLKVKYPTFLYPFTKIIFAYFLSKVIVFTKLPNKIFKKK